MSEAPVSGMMDYYDELLERLKEIDLIGQIGSLLGWDQEVMMPPQAGALRAEHLAWASKEGHTRKTDPRIGELLDELEGRGGLDEIQMANIRLARESYDKATRLPTEFVSEMAKHNSRALVSWTEARKENDFSIFRDDLAKSIEFARKKADYLGYENLRYDALLDIYESGLTVSRLDPLFEGLRDKVAPLIKSVAERGERPDVSWVTGNSWEQEGQERLSQRVSESIGFDFDAG
ncbi:MAG: hypothetical protein CMA71_05835, partial [Euryarchaeota archaeon]|nr:hypothetical protein [Euryarchaeota archaeon]